MDYTRAHECLTEVLGLIDQWGVLYERRWAKRPPYQEHPELDSKVREGIDEVRTRTKFAHDVITAMGENKLAEKVVEHEEGQFGEHPFTQARIAIVEAIAILAQREELAEILGPVGPQLSASELHSVIWGAAAALWDDGYFPQAVQTAAKALEGLLQAKSGASVSGENLGNLFSTNNPTQGSPRLRLRDVDDPSSNTFKSAHEGAAAIGVRDQVAGHVAQNREHLKSLRGSRLGPPEAYRGACLDRLNPEQEAHFLRMGLVERIAADEQPAIAANAPQTVDLDTEPEAVDDDDDDDAGLREDEPSEVVDELVAECVESLNRLLLQPDCGAPTARKALRESGQHYANSVVCEAVRARKAALIGTATT